ncbi:hypothetical protein BU15DRAFT_68980 [Melanogaster broomeanus]|nr:hypothetical protein BU15DRAFT_68980 [Melanogaster broomeanus]
MVLQGAVLVGGGVLLVLSFAYLLWINFVAKHPLDNIPGPPSQHWYWGNIGQTFGPYGWDYLKMLTDRYGHIVKIHGLFGRRLLESFKFAPTQEIAWTIGLSTPKVKDSEDASDRLPLRVELIGEQDVEWIRESEQDSGQCSWWFSTAHRWFNKAPANFFRHYVEQRLESCHPRPPAFGSDWGMRLLQPHVRPSRRHCPPTPPRLNLRIQSEFRSGDVAIGRNDAQTAPAIQTRDDWRTKDSLGKQRTILSTRTNAVRGLDILLDLET